MIRGPQSFSYIVYIQRIKALLSNARVCVGVGGCACYFQFEAGGCGVHESLAWESEHYSSHCQSGLSHSQRDKEAKGPGEYATRPYLTLYCNWILLILRRTVSSVYIADLITSRFLFVLRFEMRLSALGLRCTSFLSATLMRTRSLNRWTKNWRWVRGNRASTENA